MLQYILWDQSSELFTWGQFTLRWDGLLLIVAFIIGRQILAYGYAREGKPVREVDVLCAYLIFFSFIGARMGQVFFYQPDLLTKPLSIFLPVEFKPKFHFTGLTGFSSFGAVLGIIAAVWIYVRVRKQPIGFLAVLDRVSLLSVWITIPILIGSFLNSEIVGKPTSSSFGTLFIKPIEDGLLQLPCCIMRNPGGKNPITEVYATKGKDVAIRENGHHSVALYLFFKQETPVETVDEFMLGDVKAFLYDHSKIVDEPGTIPLHYAIFKESTGDFDARVRTIGITRYPVQLFEALTSMILFAFLIWYWNRYRVTIPEGRLFGFSMILFWCLRFLFEFLKDDQTSFMKSSMLNKAQWMCLPLILVGVIVLFRSYRKTIPLGAK